MQAQNLQCKYPRAECTNASGMQGRFVLDDSTLRWLTALKQPRSEATSTAGGASPSADVRAQTAARKTMTELYVALACASIKGALSHLNMPCSVMGNSDIAPACANPLPLRLNRSGLARWLQHTAWESTVKHTNPLHCNPGVCR